MDYQSQTGQVTPTPRRIAGEGRAPAVSQIYGNAVANQDLARAQQSPVDVAVVADDGTTTMDLATASQILFGSETGSFPNLDGIAAAALAQAEGHPIRRLRIVVHGAPGRMWFGDQSMDYLHFVGGASSFSALKGHFAPDGFIELHSCELAAFAESEGTDALISAIALATGVPVVASRALQQPISPGLDGSTVTWTPQADGTTTRSERPAPKEDAVMEAIGDLRDWIYGL